ncbi:hypothetical protein B0H17DRAFT_1145929 [Mycena rosella]|uniref:Uncharacterized protein n=1 Tax=Mycena rosella TaxID=1033263 RepID=A0AAD7G1B4_MYCRO|nr:hypothetical protein B0H17DRAFT_1145929 [Mycena rosella]
MSRNQVSFYWLEKRSGSSYRPTRTPSSPSPSPKSTPSARRWQKSLSHKESKRKIAPGEIHWACSLRIVAKRSASEILFKAADAALISKPPTELDPASIFFLDKLRRYGGAINEGELRKPGKLWMGAARCPGTPVMHPPQDRCRDSNIGPGYPRSSVSFPYLASLKPGQRSKHLTQITSRGLFAVSRPPWICMLMTPRKFWNDAYDNVAKRVDNLPIARSVVKAALGLQLKSLLFGARLAAEILTDLANVRRLEIALGMRIELIGKLDEFLRTYTEKNPLAAALKPTTAKALKSLWALKADLSHATVGTVMQELDELGRDFQDSCTAIMLPYKLQIPRLTPATHSRMNPQPSDRVGFRAQLYRSRSTSRATTEFERGGRMEMRRGGVTVRGSWRGGSEAGGVAGFRCEDERRRGAGLRARRGETGTSTCGRRGVQHGGAVWGGGCGGVQLRGEACTMARRCGHCFVCRSCGRVVEFEQRGGDEAHRWLLSRLAQGEHSDEIQQGGPFQVPWL